MLVCSSWFMVKRGRRIVSLITENTADVDPTSQLRKKVIIFITHEQKEGIYKQQYVQTIYNNN